MADAGMAIFRGGGATKTTYKMLNFNRNWMIFDLSMHECITLNDQNMKVG